MAMNWLTGFHAVEEALAAGRALDRIVIARGRHGERVEAVVQLAKAKGVPVRFEDRVQIDRLVGTREHQGVAALGAAKPAMGLEDLLAAQTPQGLLVLLDGVEDPHNLGAVVRTALASKLVDLFSLPPSPIASAPVSFRCANRKSCPGRLPPSPINSNTASTSSNCTKTPSSPAKPSCFVTICSQRAAPPQPPSS